MVAPTQEQIAAVSDRRRLMESVISVEDKDRQLVPFILNPIQSDMHDTSTIRDVYVKPSQVGATTYFMCDFLMDCITIPGTTSVIISYDEFITGRLLRKADSMYTNLRNRFPSIPQYKHKSTFEKTYVFEDSMGVIRGESSFYISSAKSFSMPRGEPIHNLLLDELGFWPTGAVKDAFAAALQRVPLRQNTKVRVLSTPNGEDNDFYEIYMAAKEGKEYGKSIFKAHFYAWYEHPEYSLPYDSPIVLIGDDTHILKDLSEDERVLTTRFESMGISEEEAYNKLRWRRFKIVEMASLKRSGETALLFSQEYPEDDVSCFQAAGDMWYDSARINDMAKQCYEAPYHMLFADIWELPEEGAVYLEATDPGLGKKSMSVSTIWKITANCIKHCATLAGLYDNPEMASKSKALGFFYNTAYMAVEDALGYVAHISDYPNLYYRTDPDTGKVSNNIGWATTRSTKPYMCNEVSRFLPIIECYDRRIIEQCRNIKEQQSQGRLIPISVGADDFHDSMAIAIVCKQDSYGTSRGYTGSKGWGDTWGR